MYHIIANIYNRRNLAIMNTKKRKISILGAGNVGATIAYALTLQGVCSEIVLVDINKEKAEGEALDITQCGYTGIIEAKEFTLIRICDLVLGKPIWVPFNSFL